VSKHELSPANPNQPNDFKSIFMQKENKNYKVINELGEGNFLGEVALITNLPRTSTVLASVGTATCGYINKEEFKKLTLSYPGIISKLNQRIMSYNDDFFKTREWIFRSIYEFRKLKKEHLRNFTLKMEEINFNDGETILEF
jgi:CRP-like cAMP-binding protein